MKGTARCLDPLHHGQGHREVGNDAQGTLSMKAYPRPLDFGVLLGA